MAIAWTNIDMTVFGDRKVIFATGTFDSSYPSAGESIAASDFGGRLEQIDMVIPGTPSVDNEAIVACRWDRSAGTLLITDAAGALEGDATDLSSTTVDVMVVGK